MMAQCDDHFFYKKFECHDINDNDFLISSFNIFKMIFGFIYGNFMVLSLSVMTYFLLDLLYRTFWKALRIKKQLSDVGFDHSPEGQERNRLVSRSLKTRYIGCTIPPAYPNGWYTILESSDLKIGDARTVTALGQDLCVYRGEDKIARCVDAYCPHLGANLGVGGSVRGNCIECPFHKWRFSGDDGACTYVPGLEQAPKGVTLKHWTTKEVNNCIWIWYDAEKREPLWDISDAPELATWGFRGSVEYTVGAHIQDLLENAADFAHFDTVHSNSFVSSIGKKYPFLDKYLGHHYWEGGWTKGDDHTATTDFTNDFKILKHDLFRTHIQGIEIGPSEVQLRTQSFIGPVLILVTALPLAPNVQRLIHRVYSPAYNGPLAALHLMSLARLFEPDIAVWNNKKYMSAPPYGRLDKTIRIFRSWYLQFYSENSISFNDAMKNNLEW